MSRMHVGYYVPEVPDISSTTEYNHAVGLTEYADESVLFTHRDPPVGIRQAFDDVHVLGDEGYGDRSLVGKLRSRYDDARRAAALAEDLLGDAGTFVTTFHYGPALAGTMADTEWVLDVYDDPYQYIYESPRSVHSVLARVLTLLLSRVHRAVHTIHPASPRLFGDDRRFALNGAAIETIEATGKPAREPLSCVWAGKHLSEGVIEPALSAIARTSHDVVIDVFGGPTGPAREHADTLDVSDRVTFHGRRPHEEVCRSIERAHVGFCLLPRRTDWQFAYPLKIGEYLAGGAVPICSPLYGTREIARNAGIYVEPTADAIAGALDDIAAADDSVDRRRRNRCRRRAEAIPWSEERTWFAMQALE